MRGLPGPRFPFKERPMGLFFIVIAAFEVLVVALTIKDAPDPESKGNECDSDFAG
jgi:hypothetical protein